MLLPLHACHHASQSDSDRHRIEFRLQSDGDSAGLEVWPDCSQNPTNLLSKFSQFVVEIQLMFDSGWIAVGIRPDSDDAEHLLVFGRGMQWRCLGMKNYCAFPSAIGCRRMGGTDG